MLDVQLDVVDPVCPAIQDKLTTRRLQGKTNVYAAAAGGVSGLLVLGAVANQFGDVNATMNNLAVSSGM